MLIGRAFLNIIVCVACVVLLLFFPYIHRSNAFLAVLLSLPTFELGYYIGGKQHLVEIIKEKVSSLPVILIVITIAILAFLSYQVAIINGNVYLYVNEFGNNPILYVVGVFLGCLFCYVASIKVDKGIREKRIIEIMSRGNFVTLAFHLHITRCMTTYINQLYNIDTTLLIFGESMLIMIIMIPFQYIYYLIISHKWITK